METSTIAETATSSDSFIGVEDVAEQAGKFAEYIDKITPKLIAFGLKLLLLIVILIVGRMIIKAIMKVVAKFFDRTKIEHGAKKFIESFIRAVLHVILIMIILEQVGFQTTSIFALLSSAGLTLGFALQGSLSNFAGGVIIMIFQPFKVGDYIVVAGDTTKQGIVKKIDIFYTYLDTYDNVRIAVPNGVASNNQIINKTGNGLRRVDIRIGIGYKENIDEARNVIIKTCSSQKEIIKEKGVVVDVEQLAESQITLLVKTWCDVDDYWTVLYSLNEKIKKAFDANHIEIPFNQLSVHIRNDK